MADFFAFLLALVLYVGGSFILGGLIWLPFKLIFNTPFNWEVFCGIGLFLEALLVVPFFVREKKK